MALAEAPCEKGLADSGLAGHENEMSAAPGRLGKAFLKRHEERRALEHLYAGGRVRGAWDGPCHEPIVNVGDYKRNLGIVPPNIGNSPDAPHAPPL